MIRLSLAYLVLLAAAVAVSSFTPVAETSRTLVSLQMGYVPDGFTPEQWKKKQSEERAKQKGKNFGAVGPTSFKSRSLQSFQTELEQGKTGHLMPVMFAKDRVKKGELKETDIPYMQRNGSWDNSDVKGAKKKQWNKLDKKYEETSKSFFNLDWTGGAPRKGPTAAKGKPEKPQKPATKKLFGMW